MNHDILIPLVMLFLTVIGLLLKIWKWLDQRLNDLRDQLEKKVGRSEWQRMMDKMDYRIGRIEKKARSRK